MKKYTARQITKYDVIADSLSDESLLPMYHVSSATERIDAGRDLEAFTFSVRRVIDGRKWDSNYEVTRQFVEGVRNRQIIIDHVRAMLRRQIVGGN
jgi:hypothetical protein